MRFVYRHQIMNFIWAAKLFFFCNICVLTPPSHLARFCSYDFPSPSSISQEPQLNWGAETELPEFFLLNASNTLLLAVSRCFSSWSLLHGWMLRIIGMRTGILARRRETLGLREEGCYFENLSIQSLYSLAGPETYKFSKISRQILGSPTP